MFWSILVMLLWGGPLGCIDPKSTEDIGKLLGEIPHGSVRQVILWKTAVIGDQMRALQENTSEPFQILSPPRAKSLVTIVEWPSLNAAEKAREKLKERNDIESVTDDFKLPFEIRGSSIREPLQEPYLSRAWHLEKMEVAAAWNQSMGDPSILVAVVDLGFEQNHPEFIAAPRSGEEEPDAWFVNSAEIPGNNQDDDGNGLIDDVSGWNFATNSANLIYGAAPTHGTAVASIIGGRINGRGSLGVCPRCALLPVVIDDKISSIVLAYQYISQFPVAVVNNSWGFRLVLPEMESLIQVLKEVYHNGRAGLGTGIVFAMSNNHRNDCLGSTPDISSLPFVIAVSGMNRNERKIYKSGFGDCTDLVAPTSENTREAIVAADRVGSKGTNQGSGDDLDDWDYTQKFYGTSAAAPQVAAALALVIGQRSQETIQTAQDILFRQAKKVDPDTGSYDPETGRSVHYGYGMVSLQALGI